MGCGVLPPPDAERRPKSQSLLTRAPEFAQDVEIARSLGLTTEAFYALSADEQSIQSAAWAIERNRCPKCGNPASECSDHAKPWYPQRHICYATMEREAAIWRYQELHKDAPYHDGTFTSWSKDRTLSTPYHFGDGVTITTTAVDYRPDDDFLSVTQHVADSEGHEAGDGDEPAEGEPPGM